MFKYINVIAGGLFVIPTRVTKVRINSIGDEYVIRYNWHLTANYFSPVWWVLIIILVVYYFISGGISKILTMKWNGKGPMHGKILQEKDKFKLWMYYEGLGKK